MSNHARHRSAKGQDIYLNIKIFYNEINTIGILFILINGVTKLIRDCVLVVFRGIRETYKKVDRMIRENVIFPKRMKHMWSSEQLTDIAKNYLPDIKFPIARKVHVQYLCNQATDTCIYISTLI